MRGLTLGSPVSVSLPHLERVVVHGRHRPRVAPGEPAPVDEGGDKQDQALDACDTSQVE